MSTPIYLDYAASTPVDPRVLDAMLPWFTDRPANTASQHGPGVQATEAVEQARNQVADMLGCDAAAVCFVSGATESCNLALKGLMRPRLRRGEPVHIISTAIEHAAVLEPLRRLEREGAEIDLVPPTPGGCIDPAAVERRLREDTALVSVMWVNNELGTVNDVGAIGSLCRDRGVLMHCDASQAPGKVAIDLSTLPLDAVSVCAHKMYGPKGAGALVLQGRAEGRPVEPLLEGDGHEQGLRSGTLDVPALVGWGAACDLVQEEFEADRDRIATFRDRLIQVAKEVVPSMRVNGDPSQCVPHILNLTLPSPSPDALIDRLPGIACTGGAACASLRNAGSHVLTAIGVDTSAVPHTIRLSLGRPTTEADIAAATAHLQTLN
ncbi:MAG: cysteine desulfurase family protein [Phycisphaerales bacterium]|jgi:cysteine desulfurase|nr:cysteine desulfurase family protein [Phycisphaerales bacterium]